LRKFLPFTPLSLKGKTGVRLEVNSFLDRFIGAGQEIKIFLRVPIIQWKPLTLHPWWMDPDPNSIRDWVVWW
jgi:hypothetical protein